MRRRNDIKVITRSRHSEVTVISRATGIVRESVAKRSGAARHVRVATGVEDR